MRPIAPSLKAAPKHRLPIEPRDVRPFFDQFSRNPKGIWTDAVGSESKRIRYQAGQKIASDIDVDW